MVENIAIAVKIIAAIVYFILFLLTIKGKVGLELKILFSFYILGLLLWQFSSLMIHFSLTKEKALFWYKLLASGVTLQSILFLPFSQAFLNIKKQKILAYLSYISALTIAIIPFSLNLYAGVYIGKGGYYIPIFTRLFYIFGLIGYLYWGIGVYNFTKYYFLEKSKLQKNRIKYVLYGALIVIIGSASNFTFLQNYPIDIVCNLINAILITYAVRKYHLLELKIVFKKSMLIFLVILSIIFLFLLNDYLIGLVPKFTKEQSAGFSGIISAILILIFILIVQTEKLNNFFQNILYPELKDYQGALEEYSKNITSITDIEKLKQYFFNTVKNIISTEWLIFMLYDDMKKKYTKELRENNKFNNCVINDLERNNPLVDLLKEKRSPILKDELLLSPVYSKVALKAHDFLKNPCIEVIVPIVITNKLYGLLLLGEKNNKKAYSVQDLRFLATLSHTTATGILNLRSYTELQSKLAEQMLLFLLSENYSKSEKLELLLERSCSIFVDFLKINWATIGIFLPGFEDRVIGAGNINEKDIAFVKLMKQLLENNQELILDREFEDDINKYIFSFKTPVKKNIYPFTDCLLFIPLLYNYRSIGFILLKFKNATQKIRFIEERYSLLKSIKTIVSQGIALHYTVIELEAIKNRNEMILEGVGNSGNIIIITDTERKIKRVNSALSKLLGYTDDEILGNDILNYISIADLKNNDKLKLVNDYKSNGDIESFNVSLLKKDGSMLPAILSVVKIQNRTNESSSLLFIAKDISAVKIAEENVKKSEEKYRRLFSEIDEIIIILDQDGVITDINPAGISLFGYNSQKTLVGKNIKDIFISEQDIFNKIYNEALEKGQVKNRELSIKKDGRDFYFIVNINPVYDKNKNISEIRILIHDITEMKSLEKQLFQAQKMESIGTLAGGIAHDFNNILTAILGYASIMKSKVEPGHPFCEYLDIIESSATRASALTGKLLAFARAGKYQEKLIDINKLISEIVALLKETIERNIEIVLDLNPDLPSVKGDENQLHQVIMNLCVNARDAMPEGGKLIIKTGIRDLQENYVKTHMGAKKGRYVFVSVEDTGCGIEEENIKRIFDPFFTTKEKGKGTGLGLSVVYGVVKNHNGYIDVRSRVGQGTIFEVFLPPENKSIRVKEEIKKNPLKGRGETILVVDDEESVRKLLKDILEANGYRVIMAKDGIDGINIYKKYYNKIDLVILDMVMPKLSGEQTFDKLKKINTDIKILLSTGYSNDQKLNNLFKKGIQDIVKKPFNIEDLLNKIGKLI